MRTPAPPLTHLTHLTPPYRAFCAFETVAINGVGCATLTFQDALSAACPYPGLYQFWLVPTAAPSEAETLLGLMLAGWLAVAGTLQCGINFDPRVPLRTKLVALYAFALCDVFWLALMAQHAHCFTVYHIVGSLFTISQRARFWLPGRREAAFERAESGAPPARG